MKKILFLGFVFLSLSSHSQNLNYSISISFNQLFINNIEKTPDIPNYYTSSGNTSYMTNIGTLVESYKAKLGGNLSGIINYSINSKLFIEGGLQINLIRYHQDIYIKSNSDYEEITIQLDTTNIITDFFGNPITDYQSNYNELDDSDKDKLGNITALYTALPIKVGYSFLKNKLKCKIGVIPSFLSYATTFETDYYNQITKNTSADGFKNLVWNGSLEIEYLVYKNIGINLNYSRSLNSIYDDYASVGEPKYNVFSLGISYNYFK